MIKFNYLKLSLLLCTIFNGISIAKNPEKDTTFLCYMAANNDLCFPFANLNLTQMSKVGSNDNINILVFANEYCQTLDEYNQNTSSARYNRTCKIVVKKESFSREVLSTARDSGSETTLMEALDWAMSEYPSKNFILDLWDHGSGGLNRSQLNPSRAICFDYVTGHFLTDKKVQIALDYACKKYRNGKKLDIVCCDACLMSCVEFAYAMVPYADNLLSAQETIPGSGYNYTTFLAPYASGVPLVNDVLKNGVSAFANNYSGNGYSFTLSAINLNNTAALFNNINALSDILIGLLNSYSSSGKVARAIKSAALNSHYFTEPYYIDLKDFYLKLSSALSVIALDVQTLNKLNNVLSEGINLIKSSDLILANAFSQDHRLAAGISIYFPIHKSYSGAYTFRVDKTYSTVQFALNNSYSKFIELWTRSL